MIPSAGFSAAAAASSSSPSCYDLLIIGRGLLGSAAARHAAAILDGRPGRRIALVGPSEPSSKSPPFDSTTTTRDIFGAHYDEGRITRRTDMDPVWAELASRSISRYGEIARRARGDGDGEGEGDDGKGRGEFYVECGHLAVGPAGSDSITKRRATAEAMGVDFQSLDGTELRERFPHLHFPDGCAGLFEGRDAGFVSARGLVKAQTTAAVRSGRVDVFESVVGEVRRCLNDDDDIGSDSEEGGPRFEVRLEQKSEGADGGNNSVRSAQGGTTLRARRVLVTAGAFTSARPLLPVRLDMTPIRTQTVHFFLSPTDAHRLASLPSVIFKDPTMWAYLLPPMQYPDGTVRLKLGGAYLGADGDEYGPSREMASGNEQVAEWYNSRGGDAARQDMIEMLHSIVPGVAPLEVLSDACATLNTPTRQAFIGQMEEGWYVATGGNGFAAKSSDELGRLGALCALDYAGFCGEEICGRRVAEVMRPRVIPDR